MADSSLPPAGKYRLLAARWRQVVKVEAGRPVDWLDHRRGAEVDLDPETADRLLRAKAVEPTTKGQERHDAVQEALAAPDAAAAAAQQAQAVQPVPAAAEPVPANPPGAPGK